MTYGLRFRKPRPSAAGPLSRRTLRRRRSDHVPSRVSPPPPPPEAVDCWRISRSLPHPSRVSSILLPTHTVFAEGGGKNTNLPRKNNNNNNNNCLKVIQ